MMGFKQLGLVGALASTMAFGVGCARTNEMLGRNQQTWTMETAGKMPAAQGKVQVATDEKGNRDVRVEVKHIAPPDQVFDGTSTYVVWLKPAEGTAQNIGVLSPDKDLNASLSTTTPFTSFKVMVTAESTPTPTHPSGNEVMTANVHVAS
jgi:FlaG/FlaF family flagellin (archaellin)